MREEGFKQPGAPSVDTRHPAARVHEWVSWEAENLAWWPTHGRCSVNRCAYCYPYDAWWKGQLGLGRKGRRDRHTSSLERRGAALASYPAESGADLTVFHPLWIYHQVHLTDEGSEAGQGGAPCPHGHMEDQRQQGANPD